MKLKCMGTDFFSVASLTILSDNILLYIQLQHHASITLLNDVPDIVYYGKVIHVKLHTSSEVSTLLILNGGSS